jgi:hypothetical protein
LYLIEKNKTKEPIINTINIAKNNQEYSFNYHLESNADVRFSPPENYLYESNASLLKAGAFNSICDQFNLKKLAPNSHLYTSEHKIKNFPGRTFKIENTISYALKEFKKTGILNANVSCRNFKNNVDEVKKKLKIKDGGEKYIFATTDMNNKPILIVCIKDKE